MDRPHQTYESTVTLRILVRVEAPSVDAAVERAKAFACQRQGIRAEHIDNAWATPIQGDALRSAENLRAWQESQAVNQHGSASQRERWLAKCLPEAELLDLARGQLFRPFALFQKRTPMGFAAIDHPRNAGNLWRCLTIPRASGPVSDPNELVRWETLHSPELTAREHDTLRLLNDHAREVAMHPWLRQAPVVEWRDGVPVDLGRAGVGARMPEVVGVSPREHRGSCTVCTGSVYERSALVSIYWAGRVLSREYVLR